MHAADHALLPPGLAAVAANGVSNAALLTMSTPPPVEASKTTSPPTDATDEGDEDEEGLSGGAIAGIVVGSLAALVIAAVLVFHVGRGTGAVPAGPAGTKYYRRPSDRTRAITTPVNKRTPYLPF